MSFGVGCVLLISTFTTPWFSGFMPWYWQWLEYALVVGMLVMVGYGLVKMVASLRPDQGPDQTPVHGGAQPAPEADAKAAARGDANKSSPLHDQTFPD